MIHCIYHNNCTDGFAAAFIVHKYANSKREEVSFLAYDYDQFVDPSQFSNSTVYIVDFSFPNIILEKIAKFAKEVVVIDHHKSFFTQQPWPNLPNLKIIFDSSMSGALLTYNYLNTDTNESLRDLIIRVSDYDTWKFEYDDTKEFILGLTSYPKDSIIWQELISKPNIVDYLVAEGKSIKRFTDRIVEDIINTTAGSCILGLNGEYKGLVCNANKIFANEIGTRLAEMTGTYGATYYIDSNSKENWSLRSLPGYDVSKIAQEYGGGGHETSAGFVLNITDC